MPSSAQLQGESSLRTQLTEFQSRAQRPSSRGRVRPAMTVSRSRSSPVARGCGGWEAVLSDGVESQSGRPFTLGLGQDGRKGADVAGEGGYLGAVGRDGLKRELFGLGEVLGAAEGPSGDSAS